MVWNEAVRIMGDLFDDVWGAECFDCFPPLLLLYIDASDVSLIIYPYLVCMSNGGSRVVTYYLERTVDDGTSVP